MWAHTVRVSMLSLSFSLSLFLSFSLCLLPSSLSLYSYLVKFYIDSFESDYMAPEMLYEDESYGTAIDIWSTGIVAYALLCGRLPFTDDVS